MSFQFPRFVCSFRGWSSNVCDSILQRGQRHRRARHMLCEGATSMLPAVDYCVGDTVAHRGDEAPVEHLCANVHFSYCGFFGDLVSQLYFLYNLLVSVLGVSAWRSYNGLLWTSVISFQSFMYFICRLRCYKYLARSCSDGLERRPVLKTWTHHVTPSIRTYNSGVAIKLS